MKVVEFRGCDNVVVAEVTKDDNTGYTVGNVVPLAPVAEVSKTTENSSETHYYDNVGAIVIRTEGSDEITLTVPALELGQLATITGKSVDPATSLTKQAQQSQILLIQTIRALFSQETRHSIHSRPEISRAEQRQSLLMNAMALQT